MRNILEESIFIEKGFFMRKNVVSDAVRQAVVCALLTLSIPMLSVFGLFMPIFSAFCLVGAMPDAVFAADSAEIADVVEVADVVESDRVIVGGHSLGIVLQSDGAVVVGFTPVYDAAGAEVYPAREAGVQVEDMLLAVNGKPVSRNQEVADMINELGPTGEDVILLVRREGRELDIAVQPVLCSESGMWRIGLYIRDANAGIGTLTFYQPSSGAYGALGHKIEDGSGDNTDNIAGQNAADGTLGRVLAANVQYIRSSVDGEPGEKVGVFDAGKLSGTITANCELGVYGRLNEAPTNGLYPDPVEVAAASEVHSGEATMLTVLEGEEIEEFSVNIERVTAQKHAGDKGMVINVTDERLIDVAGGIVQGMSGSPIMQDGKLVGAVTHVFIDDSLSGYGCFAQWMVEAAG